MALSSSQLVLGKRVRVERFSATIGQDGSYDDDGNLSPETYQGKGIQVRVKDDRGNSHYVTLSALEVPVPYVDGGLYLSAGGQFVFYVANPDDSTKPGTWRLRLESGTRGTQVRSFAYPTRPLVQVNLGDTLTD